MSAPVQVDDPRDLPAEDLRAVLQALLDTLDMKVMRERTPDYTSYTVEKNTRY
jgi:hypothetical protein